VILVEKRPRLLEFADAEMVEALSYNLRDHRVTMRLNEEVASVEDKGSDGVVARMKSNKSSAAMCCCTGGQAGQRGRVDLARRAGRGQPRADRGGRGSTGPKCEHLAAGDIIGFEPGVGIDGAGALAAAQRGGFEIQSNPATYP